MPARANARHGAPRPRKARACKPLQMTWQPSRNPVAGRSQEPCSRSGRDAPANGGQPADRIGIRASPAKKASPEESAHPPTLATTPARQRRRSEKSSAKPFRPVSFWFQLSETIQLSGCTLFRSVSLRGFLGPPFRGYFVGAEVVCRISGVAVRQAGACPIFATNGPRCR